MCRADILQEGLHYGKMHLICSSLRGTISVDAVLADAEALCMYAGAAAASAFDDLPLGLGVPVSQINDLLLPPAETS